MIKTYPCLVCDPNIIEIDENDIKVPEDLMCTECKAKIVIPESPEMNCVICGKKAMDERDCGCCDCDTRCTVCKEPYCEDHFEDNLTMWWSQQAKYMRENHPGVFDEDTNYICRKCEEKYNIQDLPPDPQVAADEKALEEAMMKELGFS